MTCVDIFRLALLQGVERGYRGPGSGLWRLSDEDLARVILAGDHLPTLRSADFARSLFRPRLRAQVHTGAPLVYQDWEDIKRRAEHRQATLVGAADPLESLATSMAEWLR